MSIDSCARGITRVSTSDSFHLLKLIFFPCQHKHPSTGGLEFESPELFNIIHPSPGTVRQSCQRSPHTSAFP